MEIILAFTEFHLQGILELQRKNLKRNVPIDERERFGFVTLEYNLDFLKNCTDSKYHIIAIDKDIVIGYVLVIDRHRKSLMPAGQGMFDVFEALPFGMGQFADSNYIVVGQACVDRAYSGQGLLGKMYEVYKTEYELKYDLAMTDISTKNTRSLRAHAKVGFETVHTFYEPDAMDYWDIVVWDWKK